MYLLDGPPNTKYQGCPVDPDYYPTEAEIQPGLNLLGPIKQKFLQVSDVFQPCDDGTASQLFISKSYDATSHFETTCLDVLDIFKRATGEDFDVSKVKHTLEDQE